MRAVKHHYDCETGTWVATPTVVEIGEVFARGGMRAAHEAIEDGVPSVVKFSTIHRGLKAQKEGCLRDSRAQSVAECYSNMFNKEDAEVKIGFVASDALELPDGRWANVEPRLGGRYEKHNNNAGAIITGDEAAQAFSHYTYEKSFHTLLVCDIQGVGQMYTDPQILSAASSKAEPFGDGDLGDVGIKAFLRAHKCNDICRQLRLPENALYRGPATHMPKPIVPRLRELSPGNPSHKDVPSGGAVKRDERSRREELELQRALAASAREEAEREDARVALAVAASKMEVRVHVNPRNGNPRNGHQVQRKPRDTETRYVEGQLLAAAIAASRRSAGDNCRHPILTPSYSMLAMETPTQT